MSGGAQGLNTGLHQPCNVVGLGFRIDPVESLQELYKEISSLHQVFSVNPIFGIDYTVEDPPEEHMKRPLPRTEEDVEIIEGDEAGDSFAAYFADSSKETDREPVFNEELGLAVEALREGALGGATSLPPAPAR